METRERGDCTQKDDHSLGGSDCGGWNSKDELDGRFAIWVRARIEISSLSAEVYREPENSKAEDAPIGRMQLSQRQLSHGWHQQRLSNVRENERRVRAPTC